MKTRFALLGLSAIITIAGCSSPLALSSANAPQGSAKKTEATAGDAGTLSPPTAAGGGNVSGNASRPATSAPRPATAPGGGTVSNNGAGMVSGDRDDEASTGGISTPGNPGATAPVAPPVDQKAAAEALKAGAVDDNAKFKDYLAYVEAFRTDDGMAPRKLDVSQRHVIRVVDSAGHGVSNAAVTIKIGETVVAEGKTYADGRTLFHPSAYQGVDAEQGSFTVSVTKGAATVAGTFAGAETKDWEVALPTVVEKPAAKLDMAIILDTTGSMGGEIKKFQSTISSIAQRLQALPQQPAVRFGLVAYKDKGEQYVSKVASPLTAEIGQFQQALNLLSPGGGADKPEDLEAALSDTMGLAWDDGEAVRLSFVVTDAGPHTDYPQSTPYTDSMQTASKKGIKLYTVGASSLESQGEYALRQLSQWTMAKYLFVTRGGDEATGGGGTASATVDAFREGRLDDIVVEIVKAELDKLGK